MEDEEDEEEEEEEEEEEDDGEKEKQQDPSNPAPYPSPPREVVNSRDGEADQAPGGGFREPSTISSSGSDKEDIDRDSDAARGSPLRGDAKWHPWRRVNTTRNKSSGASGDGDGKTGSRVSPSRGTVRHRPGYHDNRCPPPRRAKLDGENDPKCHISGDGQEEDDVGDALFTSSVCNQGGGEAFPEADGVADFDDAPSEMDCGGYSFDGGFDGIATPPAEDGAQEREDNVQDMRGGYVSPIADLGGGVEEAKGEGSAVDSGKFGGTREGTVDESLWCRQDGCPYSVDGLGGDGSSGDSMIAGAGASAAGVHRLKRGRTHKQGPFQDTQTDGSATLQAGCKEMDFGWSRFHDGGGDVDTSPDGEGPADPQDSGRGTSVRRLRREMSHGGGAYDPGPVGDAEYPCEGGVDGSDSGSGGSCYRVNGSDSGGYGIGTGRIETMSPGDRGVEGGGFLREYRSRGRGEDTQSVATPRMACEVLLVGGGDGLKISGNMGRGSETEGRASVSSGSSASDGIASGRPRFGLARSEAKGSESAAGSSFVGFPRVSLEPQSMMRLHGGGVDVTAANVRSPSKADAIRKMGSTVAVRRRNEFGRRTGLTWSVLPGGMGGTRSGGKLCPTPDAVFDAIWEKYGRAWESFVLQK
ncbi:unnamed protein product [Ectocarpus sp. 13 AM-2016]